MPHGWGFGRLLQKDGESSLRYTRMVRDGVKSEFLEW